MTWKKVILWALICGVVPGLLMIPEVLRDSSMTNPGTCFEFWFPAALFVILNCKKPLEAGLKTFLFFLISQPIIYLVQVPFSWRQWELFSYYGRWFVLTFFTLPGGIIAWYAKKGGWIGAAILSVMNLMLYAMEFPYHFCKLLSIFPRQLIACVFIPIISIFMIFRLIKERTPRIFSLGLCVVFLIVGFLVIQCL